MLAASLIDLDEKTIPDSITVPGTLLGLLLAAVYPWSLLPATHFVAGGRTLVEFLTLASPNAWPRELAGSAGTWLALGCWTVWCFALLPRRWNTRRGWGVAMRVLWHRLRAERLTYAAAGAVEPGHVRCWCCSRVACRSRIGRAYLPRWWAWLPAAA